MPAERILRHDTGEGHILHVADWGAEDGVPVLYLHGGPGSGCPPAARRLFDAARHRVLFPDQRGAGRSTPRGRLEANTTAHLIADIEALRTRLGIDRWLVVGGSWGATLGLAYAQRHPHRVSGLVLRAVFLGTGAELRWAFETALPAFQPERHAALLAAVPGAARHGLLPRLWDAILHPDPAVHRPAAMAFYRAERALSVMVPDADAPDPAPDARLPLTPFLEAHYFRSDCFLPPGALLDGAGTLAGIPGVIVQGRLDLLCPPATSAALAARWPAARHVVIEAEGHALSHRGVFAALRDGIASLTG